MKRLLPLLVVVACGCSQAVDQRVGAQAAGEGGNPIPQTAAAEWAANEGGQTASAFPGNTPPTDKASVTPDKYWVKLEALDKAHHPAGGHGESAEVEKTHEAPTHHEESEHSH